MKKTIIAAVVAAFFAAPVVAADVTVFGTVEQEMVMADGDAVNSNYNTNSGDSEFGVKGSEDLGNGANAFFKMSYGVNAEVPGNTDAISTKDVYVGIKGGMGTIKAGQFHGFEGIVSDKTVDVFETSMRLDMNDTGRYGNSIAYITPEFAGFTGGIGMSADGDNGGADKAKTDAVDYMVSYAADNLYAGVTYRTDEVANTDTLYVGGRITMDALGLGAGYEEIDYNTVGTADGEAYIVTGDYTLGNNKFTLGYKDEDNVGSTWAVEANHAFSKRTSAYVSYATFDADAANADEDGFGIGLRHNF